MKVENKHKDQIRESFAIMQNREDLIQLLSYAKKILYGAECKPIHLRSLTYYANPKVCKNRYRTFTIKKKSGAERTINAPVSGLKTILRSLNLVLQCIYRPHKAATGFVKDKSIVDNAKEHVGHHYVLNIDLKDFFHSFDRNRVKLGFMYEPFNLRGEKEPLAFLLACLCTHPFQINDEVKTVLPQGSPTSPTLTNILCKKLDRRLNGLANRFGATFTRYADDITFSSPHNIYNKEEFTQELRRIIEVDQRLDINPQKTRLQKSGCRQEATGLIVNDKVNVRRRYVKEIRMWLYYWEKYGFDKAQKIFECDYIADKGHVKNNNANLKNVLDGKLEFLKMVKGPKNATYQGLKMRFEKLAGDGYSINKVLHVWQEKGIKKAMDVYYNNKLSEMGNIKYDFIRDLLSNNKIDQNQRGRILELTSRELEVKGTLEERVKKIEDFILKKKAQNFKLGEEKPNRQENKDLPKYIDPSYLYTFLFEYNQNPVLRSTCHDIDSEELSRICEYCGTKTYDYHQHISKIIAAYERHGKDYYAPPKIKAIIRGFLTGKDYKGKKLNWGWSTNKIKVTWKSTNLSQWAEKNPGVPVNYNEKLAETNEIELFQIDPQVISPITNEPIQNFTQLVLHFKNLFHLKSGNQSLKAILNRVNSNKDWHEKIVFEVNDSFLPNLEYFTAVDKLVQAYNKIIKLIIEQHSGAEKPKVRLKFQEINGNIHFSIHHLNGSYNKTIQNTVDRTGQTYSSLIKNQVNGLCNLFLSADFGNNEYATINLWNGKKRFSKPLNSFQGVEHLLSFPKKN